MRAVDPIREVTRTNRHVSMRCTNGGECCNGSQLSSGWVEQDWVVGRYRECRLSVNAREQRPKEVQAPAKKFIHALVLHWDSAVFDAHVMIHSYHHRLRHPLYPT